MQPMTLMIIEDIDQERALCLEHAKKKEYAEKIKFVASTNSSRRGLEVMAEQAPQGVILDLELHRGVGSGMEFLMGLKGMQLLQRPVIVVTTSTQSDHVYNLVRNLGVDFIYYKKQADYGPVAVFDTLLMLNGLVAGNFGGFAASSSTEAAIRAVEVDDLAVTEEAAGIDKDEVKRLINAELDAIGMGRHYKGRHYLLSGIFMLAIDTFYESEADDSLLYRVADEHMVAYSSVLRAIQTAIENTWYDCDPAVLAAQYTTYVSPKKGRPTANEFMHYYSDKVLEIVEENKPVRVDNYY